MERLLTQGSGMFCCFKPTANTQVQINNEDAEKKEAQKPPVSPVIQRIKDEKHRHDESYPQQGLLERIQVAREKAIVMEMQRDHYRLSVQDDPREPVDENG